MTTESSMETTASAAAVFSQVEQYAWDTDEEFQSGLAAILGSSSSAEQAAELTLRARCFYYSRKFSVPVDFDSYKQYRERIHASAPNGVANVSSSSVPKPSADGSSEAAPPSQAASTGGPQPPYPVSFAEIVELITSGKPIPGIKDIPTTVLEGQGTAPAKARRKKPWEKDEVAAAPATSIEEAR